MGREPKKERGEKDNNMAEGNFAGDGDLHYPDFGADAYLLPVIR